MHAMLNWLLAVCCSCSLGRLLLQLLQLRGSNSDETIIVDEFVPDVLPLDVSIFMESTMRKTWLFVKNRATEGFSLTAPRWR